MNSVQMYVRRFQNKLQSLTLLAMFGILWIPIPGHILSRYEKKIL